MVLGGEGSFVELVGAPGVPDAGREAIRRPATREWTPGMVPPPLSSRLSWPFIASNPNSTHWWIPPSCPNRGFSCLWSVRMRRAPNPILMNALKYWSAEPFFTPNPEPLGNVPPEIVGAPYES
jgi:hypothetical protein